jgi:hypothetical protein
MTSGTLPASDLKVNFCRNAKLQKDTQLPADTLNADEKG